MADIHSRTRADIEAELARFNASLAAAEEAEARGDDPKSHPDNAYNMDATTLRRFVARRTEQLAHWNED